MPIHSDDRIDVVDEERPAREVDRDLHERFVERHERVGEPAHAAPCRRALRAARCRARCRRLRPCGAGRPRGRRVASTRGRSPRACRAARACGRRTGCRSTTSVVPVPSTSSVTSTVVSLVSRCSSQRCSSSHLRQCLLERGEERVVLGGRADRDAETLLDARPAREVADEHAALEQPFPQLVGVAVDPEQQEVGAGREDLRAPAARRARRTGGRAPRPAPRRACSISARKSSATVPASCVGTESAYGSSTFSSSSITHAGATAKPSRIAASDHTFEYVRTTTSGRDSSTSSTALHGANSPYASSTTSSAPCSAASGAELLDRLARSRPCRSGCSGCRRTRPSGAAVASSSSAASTSIEKSAARSPATTSVPGDPRDVRVQRVRRLEHRGAPARARRR